MCSSSYLDLLLYHLNVLITAKLSCCLWSTMAICSLKAHRLAMILARALISLQSAVHELLQTQIACKRHKHLLCQTVKYKWPETDHFKNTFCQVYFLMINFLYHMTIKMRISASYFILFKCTDIWANILTCFPLYFRFHPPVFRLLTMNW